MQRTSDGRTRVERCPPPSPPPPPRRAALQAKLPLRVGCGPLLLTRNMTAPFRGIIEPPKKVAGFHAAAAGDSWSILGQVRGRGACTWLGALHNPRTPPAPHLAAAALAQPHPTHLAACRATMLCLVSQCGTACRRWTQGGRECRLCAACTPRELLRRTPSVLTTPPRSSALLCRSFQPIFKLTNQSVSQLTPTGGACQVQFSSSTFYSQSELASNVQLT